MADEEYVIGRALILGGGIPSFEELTEKPSIFGFPGALDLPWVRGPKTQEHLDSLGVSVDHIGDTAEVWGIIGDLPAWESPLSGCSGDVIVIPHAVSYLRFREAPHSLGVSGRLVSPWIKHLEIERILTEIRSAEFVYTGSLHVAIACWMMGKPFAVMDGLIPESEGRLKYSDFAQSAGFTMQFFKKPSDGAKWWHEGSVPVWEPSRARRMVASLPGFVLPN